jgi:hypothetical protein
MQIATREVKIKENQKLFHNRSKKKKKKRCVSMNLGLFGYKKIVISCDHDSILLYDLIP